jgi:death-on-curing family protein
MMNYLSVHDLVWINTTITGNTVPYHYERLEEVMAAQYNYGRSTDTQAQAAQLLATFLAKRPFASGNRRTAFIAVATFLSANGYTVHVEDARAAEIIWAVENATMRAREAIDALSKPSDAPFASGTATIRRLVTHLCNEHAEALKRLAEGDG